MPSERVNIVCIIVDATNALSALPAPNRAHAAPQHAACFDAGLIGAAYFAAKKSQEIGLLLQLLRAVTDTIVQSTRFQACGVISGARIPRPMMSVDRRLHT
jgi:hypothetical protein